MKRRTSQNPKREIAAVDAMTDSERHDLAEAAKYTGNPVHKSNPEDYNLTPPAAARPGKTLCDAAESIKLPQAKALLKQGILKGMVSVQSRNGWPQNVWSVSHSGDVFEAQLENQAQGSYHGYPLPLDDDLRRKIEDEWGQRQRWN